MFELFKNASSKPIYRLATSNINGRAYLDDTYFFAA